MRQSSEKKISSLLVAAMIAGVALLPIPVLAQDTPQSSSHIAFSPAEKAMHKDLDRANKTVLGGVLTGAAVGAVAGALFAKLAGGSGKDTRNAALAGAVAGGALGGVDGYRTAMLEKAGNNEVKALQDQAAVFETETARLRKVAASTERVIAEREVAIAAIKQDLEAQRITSQQAREALRSDEANLALMKKALQTQKKAYDDYVKVADSYQADDATKRDAEAKKVQYREQIASMEKTIANYSGMVLTVSRG